MRAGGARLQARVGERPRRLVRGHGPARMQKVLFRKVVQMPRRGSKKMMLLFTDVKKA